MNTRISIIGSGFGMYGLLPSFSKVKGCKVVSICGKNSPRMFDYCNKLKLQRYNDWKEMLKKEKPNAVAIAVIPKHQFEIAKYALENDISIIEIPVTFKKRIDQSKLGSDKKIKAIKFGLTYLWFILKI